jgi:hypothetical protein
MRLDMSGGSIGGGDAFNDAGDGINASGINSLRISGGNISGGSSAQGPSGGGITEEASAIRGIIDIEGGTIVGGGNMDSLYGGDAISISTSSLILNGGSVDAGMGSVEDGWLLNAFGDSYTQITGGQLGYFNSGKGILLDDMASLDIFGTDLSFSDGLLAGVLLDGNSINLEIAYSEDWSGSFNIQAVPLPGGLVMFISGLLGLFGFSKTRAIK